MKTYKILEVTTEVRGYEVKAESPADAIDKIEEVFADTNHPDITLTDYEDVTDRSYQCEGEVE